MQYLIGGASSGRSIHQFESCRRTSEYLAGISRDGDGAYVRQLNQVRYTNPHKEWKYDGRQDRSLSVCAAPLW
ncbi:unnamed protein product [Fusarium graminearum]|uniref:Uncharacterized protein n=1 Tax=Gibberella zeae TaxID=5518 RepID=A0A4E9D0G6_GIBZA|nr:unnamed protein product [Fusarium graminearum]CAG1976638.1 unnamed protein product [Fusarium graminearum]